MSLQADGSELFPGAIAQALPDIERVVANVSGRVGARLRDLPGLPPLLGPSGSIGTIAARIIGASCRPVRALLFDKTPGSNWALAWHQDRTIVVAERRDV